MSVFLPFIYFLSIENESIPRDQAEQMLQDLINEMSAVQLTLVIILNIFASLKFITFSR